MPTHDDAHMDNLTAAIDAHADLLAQIDDDHLQAAQAAYDALPANQVGTWVPPTGAPADPDDD